MGVDSGRLLGYETMSPAVIRPCLHSDHHFQGRPQDENYDRYCPGAGAYGGSYDVYVEGHEGAEVLNLTEETSYGQDYDGFVGVKLTRWVSKWV